MARSNVYSCREESSLAAGATGYFCPDIGNPPQSTGDVADTKTNAVAAGVFRHLAVRVTTNNTTSASTFSDYKNGTQGTVIVSIPSGSVGEFTDLSDADAVITTDLFATRLLNGGGGTIGWRATGMAFDATVNTATVTGNFNDVANVASTTEYGRICSGSTFSTTEVAGVQFQLPVAGTFKLFQLGLILASRTTSTTFGQRYNGLTGGGAGNATISIPGSSASGQYTGDSNTDARVAGDLFDWYWTTGSGSGNHGGLMHHSFETTDGTQYTVVVSNTSVASNRTYSANLTRYEPINGSLRADSTESNVQIRIQAAVIMSQYYAHISADTVTATSTIRIRKNAASYGNGSISIPSSSAAGWYTDLSSSDTFVFGDYAEYEIKTGATGTSMAIGQILAKMDMALLLGEAAPPVIVRQAVQNASVW